MQGPSAPTTSVAPIVLMASTARFHHPAGQPPPAGMDGAEDPLPAPRAIEAQSAVSTTSARPGPSRDQGVAGAGEHGGHTGWPDGADCGATSAGRRPHGPRGPGPASGPGVTDAPARLDPVTRGHQLFELHRLAGRLPRSAADHPRRLRSRRRGPARRSGPGRPGRVSEGTTARRSRRRPGRAPRPSAWRRCPRGPSPSPAPGCGSPPGRWTRHGRRHRGPGPPSARTRRR